MSKYTNTQLIGTADLRIGMYVTQLEVPWNETDFPIQGVLVKTHQDILTLSQYGHSICVDESKSSANSFKKFRVIPRKDSQKRVKIAYCEEHHQNYRKTKSISNEIVHASNVIKQLAFIFQDIRLDMINFNDKKIKKITSLSNEMVSSVLNNPDALLWITKVKASHRRVFEHTVRAAIWATLLGRSKGLNRESLVIMNMAVLLSSVGKIQLRQNVWENYNYQQMQVNFGIWPNMALEKLAHCHNISNQVLTVIGNMAERSDGSGLPNQKSKHEIPLLAQIAGLVESFDLILQPMLSVKKISFNNAIQKLRSLSGALFDEDLVNEFIQSTGLYPVGSHVLLSNGSFAVVVEQSRKRRIRGTVALTHDNKQQHLSKIKIIQLGDGKYKNVMIKREMEKMQDELGIDDLNQISHLISQYKINWFLRVIYFIRRHT